MRGPYRTRALGHITGHGPQPGPTGPAGPGGQRARVAPRIRAGCHTRMSCLQTASAAERLAAVASAVRRAAESRRVASCARRRQLGCSPPCSCRARAGLRAGLAARPSPLHFEFGIRSVPGGWRRAVTAAARRRRRPGPRASRALPPSPPAAAAAEHPGPGMPPRRPISGRRAPSPARRPPGTAVGSGRDCCPSPRRRVAGPLLGGYISWPRRRLRRATSIASPCGRGLPADIIRGNLRRRRPSRSPSPLSARRRRGDCTRRAAERARRQRDAPQQACAASRRCSSEPTSGRVAHAKPRGRLLRVCWRWCLRLLRVRCRGSRVSLLPHNTSFGRCPGPIEAAPPATPTAQPPCCVAVRRHDILGVICQDRHAPADRLQLASIVVRHGTVVRRYSPQCGDSTSVFK